jgi:purine-binding chemotaxis protein CheW
VGARGGEGGPTPEARQRILEQRARAVAASRQAPAIETLRVVAFRVGRERYAVEVGAVFHVLDARALAPLPASPPWLLGAVVARTRIVPVLDVRALVGAGEAGLTDLARIVVVEDGGDAFGLAADALEGTLELPRARLAPAHEGPFAWIAPDRLAVLDPARLGAARG